MVLVYNLLLLLSGFALLLLSGDKLVDTSVKIARRWNIPTSVIAATIIAAGTSAPEFFTSFIAGYQGKSDISIGNLLGSNSFNILAVGGLSLLLQPFGDVRGTFTSWVVLVFTTILFYFCLRDLSLTQPESFLLVGTLVAFIVFSFFRKREEPEDIDIPDSKNFGRTLLFFTVSFGGLILGAELALRGGVGLGQAAGLSERVIAITIISAGTGLPEFATSVVAAFRGHSDIAIANVVGSNIFNSLAIPGVTAAFFNLQIDSQFLGLDFYVMAGATLAIGVLYIIDKPVVRRVIGLLLFLAYSTYATKLLLDF